MSWTDEAPLAWPILTVWAGRHDHDEVPLPESLDDALRMTPTSRTGLDLTGRVYLAKSRLGLIVENHPAGVRAHLRLDAPVRLEYSAQPLAFECPAGPRAFGVNPAARSAQVLARLVHAFPNLVNAHDGAAG